MLLLVYTVVFVVAAIGRADWPLWWHWADQRLYLRSAAAFARGDLRANAHWYPLLYPLLGAPFSRLIPAAPFAVPDAALLLVAFAGFRRIAARCGVGRWTATFLFALSTIGYPWVGLLWVEPWTTTLSAALIWTALAWTLEALDDPQLAPAAAARLGAVLAALPLARPADAALSLALGLLLAVRLRRQGAALRGGVAAAGGLAGAYLFLHVRIYGWAPTPYMQLSQAFGLNLGWIGWKAYILLVEPAPWFPDGEALLRFMPWLVLGAAGLVTRALAGPGCGTARLLLGVALLYAVLNLAYVDFLPSGLWRFNNAHYLKWLLPLLALHAWLFLRDLPRRPVPALAVLAALLTLGAARIELTPAAAGAPARVLAFRAPPGDFVTLYMARSLVVDSRGTQRQLFEYHQVPHPGGLVLAVALKRPFAGGERWWGAAPPGTRWPATAAGALGGAALPGAWPQTPLARFDHRVTIGWPCWLPPYPCEQQAERPLLPVRQIVAPAPALGH